MSYIEAFDYQEVDCSPNSELLDENIKGIELEIRTDEPYSAILEELIDTNHLLSATNYDYEKDRGNMYLEYDGSVDYEIKLQADTNKEDLKMIKILNEYGLNPDYIQNKHGTSCHIHLNNQYLESLGLSNIDIKKSGEFMGEILFAISGRTLNDYGQWAPSCLNCDINDDMLQKAIEIDNFDFSREFTRYQMINCNSDITTELRIFSNYCNFDYQTIKLFLEFSDHVIDIAEMMKGKKYSDNVDEIVEWTQDWFTKNQKRKNVYKDKELNTMLLTKDNIANKHKIKIENIINNFKCSNFDDKLEKEMEFWRVLRRLNGYGVNLDNKRISFGNGNINYKILDIINEGV